MRERKIMYVDRIRGAFRDPGYDVQEYLDRALHGKISPLDRKRFLAQMEYMPGKPEKRDSNFWYQKSGRQEKRTMKEQYEHQFARLFYDGDRDIAELPGLVSDVVENLKIDGVSYKQKYHMPEVSTVNCLEMICHVVRNLSEGELAEAFSGQSGREPEITFYRERSRQELCFRPSELLPLKESKRKISFRGLMEKVGGRENPAGGVQELRSTLRNKTKGGKTAGKW